MKGAKLLTVFATVAIVCSSVYADYSQSGYSPSSLGHENLSGDYQLHRVGQNEGDAAQSAASAAATNMDGDAYSQPAPSAYGMKQNLPYSSGNTRGNTLTTSITYPQNKGEILIHRPAAIIVKRPPTKVLVNHPPLVVKPAPVVLHKPPAVVLRKVFVKQHPRPVKVEPVYVNVVKPPGHKYFVNEKQGMTAGYAPAAGAPSGQYPYGTGAINVMPNLMPAMSALDQNPSPAQGVQVLPANLDNKLSYGNSY